MARSTARKFSRTAPQQRRAELIEAGIRCLGRNGLAGFTVSRISAEASVSPGLIIHYFGTKDELLAIIYETMVQRLVAAARTNAADEPPAAKLHRLIDASFPETAEQRLHLRVWLALWGEIASNPALLKAHRRQYRTYRGTVVAAIAALHPKATPEALNTAATLLIALFDGLWLEWCIDPRQIDSERARTVCLQVVAAQISAA